MSSVCHILSLCTPRKDLILSSPHPPVRYRYYSDLPWFFSSYGKANPALSFLFSLPTSLVCTCLSVLGSSELHMLLRMLLSREERMKHLLIFWLHSWMLLASFAARTADSCSPYLSVGTPSSFPANLCPSQLDSHLPAGTGLFPFRCRTSASCS